MHPLNRHLAGFFLVLCLAAFSGCATMTGSETATPFPSSESLSAVEEPQFITGFPDLPIPKNFKFNRSKSFIYEAGSGTVKIGHLFFSGWAGLDKVIPFYQNEMVNKGWSLVQFVERDVSTLHYEKENLDCNITIQSSLGKTIIEIVVGPK